MPVLGLISSSELESLELRAIKFARCSDWKIQVLNSLMRHGLGASF
jgi:hypothetical protein